MAGEISFAKSRSLFKGASRQDSISGITEQFDVREDEEQKIKLQEIIDLLLAAGYFRARIKGLSAFDKIVGGMAWCIEVSNFDVDVDLLFQDNLSIGQKIMLTEKIVAVLPKMKCPHNLEPHQIQGLDCIHIFPVVQWLVKNAIESREEHGDYNRAYAVMMFNKTHRLPRDEEKENINIIGRATAAYIKEKYRPQRKYRRNTTNEHLQEDIRVQSTLLEYGRIHGILNASSADKAEKGDGHSKEEPTTDVDLQEAKVAEEHAIQALMSGMSATREYENKISASAVGSIVGLQSAEIQQIAQEYADKKPEALDVGPRESGAQQHKLAIGLLQKQTELKKQQTDELEEKYKQVQVAHEELSAKLKEAQDFNTRLRIETEKLEEHETGENQGVLQKLRSLVSTNENLRKQEKEFRSHCKEELTRLQAKLEELKTTNMEDDSEDQERSQAISEQYQNDKEKLNKIRLLLARRNREIAVLQRKIDEVPSRAELSQYQKRFVELYNQVAATHKETKQFYTLYNTLDDTKLYLSKEINLLNSILDNFSEAMSSASTKEQFLNQFEQIVEGIKLNKTKLEKKKQEEKMQRDLLNDMYLDLVEKQRLYFKTVKDFKEECRKNEILLAKLKGHGQ